MLRLARHGFPGELPPLLGALCLGLACASGCGGGGATTVVITRTASTNSPPATTGTGTGPASTTTTSTGPSEAPGRFVHLTAFQTPSGNIACALIAGIARCDIDRRSWSPPPRPASCPSETGYGQGIAVGGSGPARFVCAGDTTKNPSAPRLGYGVASDVPPFLCVSRRSGLTCTNTRTGHGFTLSVQRYRVS